MVKNNVSPATKRDVQKIVAQAMELLLKGVEKMFEKQEKKHNGRFDKLEAGQSDLKRQLTNLKLDTPTRKEFEELKEKVDTYHPLT